MSTKPYIFTENTTLDNVRTELSFTNAMVENVPEIRRFSVDYKAMIARSAEVRADELRLWDNIVSCQANVTAADAGLDRMVDRADLVLQAITEKNRNAPLYRTFMANQRPSEVKKYVLGQELEMVRGWLPLLESSEHPQLKDLYPQAKQVVESADRASAALTNAETAAREFRTSGTRKKFIDDCNALRVRTFAAVEEYVHSHPELNLPSNYASDFFRRGRHSTKPTMESIDEQITALDSEAAALRDQRSVLAAQVEAANRVRAEADRKAAQAELERVQAEAAAALKRVEELKARINK